MADPEATTIPIPLRLPADEATALAQFAKRVDYETVAGFASPTVPLRGLPRSRCDVVRRVHAARRPGRSRLRAAIGGARARAYQTRAGRPLDRDGARRRGTGDTARQ